LGTWKVLEVNGVWEPISDYYEAVGVFCLLPRDEKYYLRTKSTKDIVMLCASTHTDSEFSAMVREGAFDSQLTKHSDNDFFKKERRGEFDDDLEKAQQLHQEEQAAEFLELARLSVFHIDKSKNLFSTLRRAGNRAI
jgi:NurA-like 5'-3' nuclease